MIRIVNLRTYRAVNGEVLIKVDRSSVLGNPFFMHNESERDSVCEQYEDYFNRQVSKNLDFTNALRNIYRVMQTQDVALRSSSLRYKSSRIGGIFLRIPLMVLTSPVKLSVPSA